MHAVKEFPDIEVDRPVLLPAPFPARPPPRPAGPPGAGTRRSPGGISVPPLSPAGPPPRFALFCPRQWARREHEPLRHAVSVFPPPSPGVGSNSPKDTRFHRSYTDYPSDLSRIPRGAPHRLPACPYWPALLIRPPHTSCFDISNGLPDGFCSPTQLLPGFLVDRTNQPRTTRPLHSAPTAPGRSFTATTSRSACTPRNGTQRLTASCCLRALPLARQYWRQYRGHAFPRSA